MSQAQALSRTYFPTFSGYFIYEKVSIREVFSLCIILSFIQILDGLLTGIGVSLYGIGAEGNLLIRAAMKHWGHIEALVIIKTIAVAIIAILFHLSMQVPWIARALRSLIMLYLVAAIYPWTFILLAEALCGEPIIL